MPNITEIRETTKNTLKANAFSTSMYAITTGFIGATTLCGILSTDDANTKKVVGLVGGVSTAIVAGMAYTSYKKMADDISNHEDVVELNIIKQFLDIKDADERDNLLGKIIDQKYDKNIIQNNGNIRRIK